jgi:hypothetical protein
LLLAHLTVLAPVCFYLFLYLGLFDRLLGAGASDGVGTGVNVFLLYLGLFA